MRLTRTFAFDAAHRIVGHAGRCAYLHGHTYELEVTVAAERLDRLGMVMDFEDLKQVVRKTVLDRWDHATLLWTEDPLASAIAGAQADAPDKVVRLAANPTAEILAQSAWDALSPSLSAGITLERLVIRETPTCRAEITRPPR